MATRCGGDHGFLVALVLLHARAGAGAAAPTVSDAPVSANFDRLADDEVFFMQLHMMDNDNGGQLPHSLVSAAGLSSTSSVASRSQREEELDGIGIGQNQTWEAAVHPKHVRKCKEHSYPEEVTANYVTDNSQLQHASKGIGYRFTKSGTDRDPRSIAFWGSIVRGVDEGGGWLRVGDCYLPMSLGGKDVIFKATDVRDRQSTQADFPFSRIKAVEASNIPGGTRITIVTGDGTANSTGDGGRMYHVDINSSNAGNLSTMSILQSLRGQVGERFPMNLNSSANGSGVNNRVYATMFRTVNGSHIFLPTGSIVMASEKQIPVWEIQQAIADAVQEGIRKAEVAAKKNHSKPTLDAVKTAVQAEVWGTWNRLAKTMRASRYKRRDRKSVRATGITVFFQSVPVIDWCFVIVAIILFTMQHWGLLHWPSTRAFHGTALVLWFILAGLYGVLIFKRQGPADGILWLNGYILELIFLVENVLVTHIIIQAFRTPRWVNEKALFIVVIARIIFQMVFYMGLAELIFSGEALPYILGLWLLYIAWQAMVDDEDCGFDIMDSRVVHLARAAFGERLWLSKDDSGALFVIKDNKRRVSLVGLMVFCLVLVDALLHVDVALTKIEELQGNGYLCFSSAVVASFCLPELVFLVRDLFRRFPALKYGISAVLVYISVQMLLHTIFRPPVIADFIVFVGLLVLSAMLPALGILPRNTVRSVDAGTQACLPPPSHMVDGASKTSGPGEYMRSFSS